MKKRNILFGLRGEKIDFRCYAFLNNQTFDSVIFDIIIYLFGCYTKRSSERYSMEHVCYF